MRCKRCEIDYFGGSVCAQCGGALERGEVKFSRMGQPLFLVGGAPAGEAVSSTPVAREEEEPGGSDGILFRLVRKTVESAFACALFSVVLRFGTFMFKVVDSLMATGGDVRPGISLIVEMRKDIGGYDVFFWVLITILIFRFRHNPR
ncbi:MAG: hypothetical protein P8123_07295 [bacterium]